MQALCLAFGYKLASTQGEAVLDLATLQTTLRHFAAERDWQALHTPKNLATALMVEAAELGEIFQWMTPEQSLAAHADAVLHERIGDEIADVLLYLLQIADHTQVDLSAAVERKLRKNAQKHPPLRTIPMPAATTFSAPRTHVLVDWENVQPKEDDIRALVPEVTDVWLFHGPAQKMVEVHHASFGDRVTRVPIARAGKNALDFHLSFYMGYIAKRHPEARFVVISNDRGYAPMLEHAALLGFSTKHVGFGAVVKSEVPAIAKPVLIAPPPNLDTPATEGLLDQHVHAVLSSLRKMAVKPKMLKGVLGVIKSRLGDKASDANLAAVLSGLLASGMVSVDDALHATYAMQTYAN
jgi:NTP pyrophosphatase (non-canonical NTP hydrolase)